MVEWLFKKVIIVNCFNFEYIYIVDDIFCGWNNVFCYSLV